MNSLSAATFEFLQDLTAGRDKAWFELNRARYESHLLGPMRALVDTIAPRLQTQIPDLECRPQVNRTLTRLNRDMRFARGHSPYKDHMLALFYREGRKKEDPQLFVGVQPAEVWVGLYLAPPLLAPDSPMARAVAERPREVVALGQRLGIGRDLILGSCTRYGQIAQQLCGDTATHYLTGPHLCALRVLTADAVAADGTAFGDRAGDILERLIPLWRFYLGDR